MALLEMTFAADALKRWVDVVAIVPVEDGGIEGVKSPEKFKTLYLLHGFGGNAKDWLTYSNIRAYAEQNKIAVIMPSGENGAYMDNEEVEVFNGKFIEELVHFTRKLFPLSDRREDTYIGGLSMGGLGALRNGMKYSELFGKIFSLSGAFIVDEIANQPKDYKDPIAGYGYYNRVFGNLESVLKSENNPVVCIKKAFERKSIPDVFMACGKDDFVLEYNRNMKKIFDELGVSIAYYEAEGNHDWAFWNDWIKVALKWILGEEAADALPASYVLTEKDC